MTMMRLMIHEDDEEEEDEDECDEKKHRSILCITNAA